MKKIRISIFLIIIVLTAAIVYFLLPKNEEKSNEDVEVIIRNMDSNLGYENALQELSVSSVRQLGEHVYYRLQQNYKGIPVYGRSVVYISDRKGENVSVTGNVEDITVSLTPTVTEEKIEEAINDYVRTELGHVEAQNISVSEIKEESLCIYSLDIERPVLAYNLQIFVMENDFLNSYNVVVDATEGNVLLCCSNIYTEMVTVELDGKSDKDMVIDLNQQRDDQGNIRYTMRDNERNIYIYNANNATLKYELYDFQDNLVKDQNGNILIKGIKYNDVYLNLISENGITEPVSEDEPPKFDKKAVSLLSNLQTTYEFYADILGIEGIGTSNEKDRIYAVYNDYNSGNITNAYSSGENGMGMRDILLSFGTKNSLKLDVVAHEYTHAIERYSSHMLYQGESGAIMEALSDIFGELVESKKSGKAPDWKHNNSRNIADPEKSNNPCVYKGVNWKDPSNPTKDNDNGEVHNNSTVIAHTANLMWDRMDGKHSEKLSKLARLWYSTMLMMPADCDFEQCRIFVELAARNLEFSKEEMKIIQEAFDEVGIYTQEFSYELSKESTLLLLGQNGELYDNFTLYILPVEIEPDAKFLISDSIDIDYIMNHSEDIRMVSKAEPYQLQLKEGVYVVAMVDNENTANAIAHTFWVHDEGADSFTIETHFGGSKTKCIKDLYTKVIDDCKRKIDYENLSDYYKNECYGLIEDLNNDGTEELILNYCKDEERYCQIWTIKENRAVCIFDILAGYYASDGHGGYLDLMEFQGKCYLTFFCRTEDISVQDACYYLSQENWIFYELTEIGCTQRHTLQIQYSYDNVYKVPRAERYMYDGEEISESRFFEICPEKVADIINLGGDCMEEDLLNSVSNVEYNVSFVSREEDFETLLKQLEKKGEDEGNEIHEVYGNFLVNKSYEKYVDYYWGEPESYAILDIDTDGIDELLIKSDYNILYDSYEYFVFKYEESSEEIIFVDGKLTENVQVPYEVLP